MHVHSLTPWVHGHAFLGAQHSTNERRTWSVVALTAVMMVAEIVGGSLFGSVALIADGWHMGTHVAALAIAGFAYLFARRHAANPQFSLGTGKFGELAAFSSAIILGIIALGIGYESLTRLMHPVAIDYAEALPIAALGLCVNVASAWLLRDDHGHSHGQAHGQAHGHAHAHAYGHSHRHAHSAAHDRGHAHHRDADHDLAHHHGRLEHARHGDTNFRAAYVHVLADALTSVATIAGLALAWAFGWTFMDPLVGLIGMLVILSWTFTLIRSAGGVLLDIVPDPALAEAIRGRIEADGDRVSDLHLWRLGPGHAALMVSVVSDKPQPPATYKKRLTGFSELSHVTVEVNVCPEH
jgi:cation diffusion facilitator family transporter